MKRFFLAGIFVVASLGSLAQAGGAAEDHLDGTPEEMAGWRAIEEGKYVHAREVAQTVLRAHADSYAGHYILGVAMHYGEANLARSIFHLYKSISLFEAHYGPIPAADAPWRWHLAALRELAYSLGEIDRPAEELTILDRFDQVYTPQRLAQRIWPLMKLQRYDAARATAKLAIASASNDSQRSLARGDLCGAEFEAGDRQATYKACVDALKDYQDRPRDGQITYSNASEAARALFRLDETERYLTESAKRADPDSWGNPFQQLAELYLAEGRIPEALEALKGGQALRMSRPSWLDQHGRARLDATIASLLMITGEAERATEIARRAVIRPDRQGSHSETKQQETAASSMLYAVTLRNHAASLEEQAVTADLLTSLQLRLRAWRERGAAWHAERHAATMLADQHFLECSLRPYYAGGINLNAWLVPSIIGVVGPGVALHALERARQAEKDIVANSYLNAFEAEAAYLRGNYDRALQLADAALISLPSAEALLRGRLAALGGESARRLGLEGRATSLFSLALTRDGGVFRRLGLALPISIESDGMPISQAAAKMLRNSPRFRSGKPGHIIRLQSHGDGAAACLLGPHGELIQCAEVRPTEKTTPQELAQQLVDKLQRVAFSIKADLSQTDLTTLDGSPTAGRAERQVRSLLDGLRSNQ